MSAVWEGSRREGKRSVTHQKIEHFRCTPGLYKRIKWCEHFWSVENVGHENIAATCAAHRLLHSEMMIASVAVALLALTASVFAKVNSQKLDNVSVCCISALSARLFFANPVFRRIRRSLRASNPHPTNQIY